MPADEIAEVGAGRRIAQYEIVRLLGKGGMGEVFEARDTRLGRSVALKVLPADLANDPARIARFEREARALAALNHPRIAVLYGFETSHGRHLLVMELVPGETLAERIARGALPVSEALVVACQIAEALEAAHEAGIVHRDLKPGNIKLTEDRAVKVLDFGLAKAVRTESDAHLATATTALTPPTRAGAVVGTVPYMSPEQARGQAVDGRTDIFALGCVLYEMLAGRRSFPGETSSDTLASVLARDPDWSQLPPLPPHLLPLLQRCLEKDPKRRWQAVGDLRYELERIAEAPHGSPAAVPDRAWLPILLAAAAGAAVVAALAWWAWPSSPMRPPVHFSFALAAGQRLTNATQQVLAISPQGDSIAYPANLQMYLRRLDQDAPTALTSVVSDINTPTFSPDGQWLAFFALGQLEKVAVRTKAVVPLATLGDDPYGADWYAPDAILVGAGAKGILRVPASGGAPQALITMQPGQLAEGPQMLPDGDHVLFTIARSATTAGWDQAQIVVQSLRSGRRTVLVQGGADARYVADGTRGRGFLLYALGANVMAVRFTPSQLATAGEPVTVVTDVLRTVAGNTGAAFYRVAGDGTLTAIVGRDWNPTWELNLFGKSGSSTPNLGLLGLVAPRIAPDGRWVAVEYSPADKLPQVWICDLQGHATPRRLTSAHWDVDPVWSPDGKQIVFGSDRDGSYALWLKAADGTSAAQRLTPGTADQQRPLAWSHDGTTVLYDSLDAEGESIWSVGAHRDRPPRPVVKGAPNADDASFSPDSRWFAYASDETGREEIWVQPWPATGAKYQVSTAGGTDPVWAPDGGRLYYLEPGAGGQQLVQVTVATSRGFSAGKPEPQPIRADWMPSVEHARTWDLVPDGQQVLAPGSASGTDVSPQIHVIVNWLTELRQRLPQ